jgi:nicotinamidase/pyrazinamidase
MKSPKIIFWNVDTQVDFMEPDGKLYVQGAEEIRPVLGKITVFAKDNNLRVVNTADYHLVNSAELSNSPDFVNTFPPHCMAETKGAMYISETDPERPLIIDWNQELMLDSRFDNPERFRNVLIRKDAFDVFAGNPYTDSVLDIIQPDRIFVYGVTTNVCVDQAVTGLAERGKEVFVFSDAIKELPNISLPFEKWEKLGVTMIPFSDVEKYMG